MRILFTLCFVFFTSPVFANQVFYNKDTNHEIIDVSNKKTLAQIKAEFGEGNYDQLMLKDDEGYRIKNQKIEAYSLQEERDAELAAKEADRQAKEDEVKAKLNLTDADFDALKEALE